MLPFNPLLSAPALVRISLTFLAISTQAARADCVLAEKNVALARVVTKEAKLHFISGPRKGVPECPSTANACRLSAYLLPGNEVLTNATDNHPYVCARFKSKNFVETMGLLPRAALEIVSSEHPSAQKWVGKWRRDSEAEIAIQSDGNDVTVSGNATWGSSDPRRVKTGAINTGELEGTSRPRGRLLAIGYDPDRSEFPPTEEAAECAAKLELHGRYLIVEDNGRCGGLNVTFNGLYVRANSN